jgi:hypothetical protein
VSVMTQQRYGQMKLKIRIDVNNPRHTHLTIFIDGANCGQLHMLSTEAFAFITTLQRGSKEGLFETEIDDTVLER